MERRIAYHPDEAEIWNSEEPKFRVRLGEQFAPFTHDDFGGKDISSPDFFISLSFTLEGFGVGDVGYQRDRLMGFDPRWAQQHAATPLGPATLAYRFHLGQSQEGTLIPPLELTVGLFGRADRYPPDLLLAFPTYGKAILGRWERRILDPGLHPLPLVIYRLSLQPEQRDIRTIYLPEDSRVLSDLRVTYLVAESRR